MSDFTTGDKVRVAADAEDCYFMGEVVGIVVYTEDAPYPEEERRVLVQAYQVGSDLMLTQWVRTADLTALDTVNN